MNAVYDFKDHKIGDCIGAGYCLQVMRELSADRIGVINRGAIDVSRWMPGCGDEFYAEAPPDWESLPRVPLGNIWITTPTVKQAHGLAPAMVCEVDDQAYDVALHCLTDAGYNVGRNHTPEQFDELERWLKWHKKTVWRVPADGMSVSEILIHIGRAKAWIGGDTGFTHAFAAMHPDRPCVAIYGDDINDIIGFEEERERMGCAHRWCSDPLSFRLYKRVMRENRFEEREVKRLLEKVLGLKAPE